MFYANTINPTLMNLELKGTGPTSLQATEVVRDKSRGGEWIAINPRQVNNILDDPNTLYFYASNLHEGINIPDAGASDVKRNFFKISDSESPSIAIKETVESLIRVINLREDLGIDAIYTATENDNPGKFALVRREPGREAFTVISNAGVEAGEKEDIDDTWSPGLRTLRHSELEESKDALYYSKFREPEAVPLLNSLSIGARKEPILRIIPLRESLFVFKTDGVYRLTGDNPASLTIEPFDLTIKLLAPESAVALSNSIYCLTNQGVVSINDNGLKIESRSIEDVIQRILRSPNASRAYAVAYESDRKYILYLPDVDGNIEEQYVLNIITYGWVRWLIKADRGVVWNNNLYISSGGFVNVERKNGKRTDYRDPQGEGIPVNLEWTTLHGGAPDKTKHYSEARVLFREAPAVESSRPNLVFQSELSRDPQEIPLHINAPKAQGSFSISPFSTTPFGSIVTQFEAQGRTYVPRNKQKSSLLQMGFNHNAAKDKVEISGISVTARLISGRTDR